MDWQSYHRESRFQIASNNIKHLGETSNQTSERLVWKKTSTIWRKILDVQSSHTHGLIGVTNLSSYKKQSVLSIQSF